MGGAIGRLSSSAAGVGTAGDAIGILRAIRDLPDAAVGHTTDPSAGIGANGSVIAILKAIRDALMPFTAPQTGELAGAIAATQMPTIACSYARFIASFDNPGRVYIGYSNAVTVANGATDITTGLQLSAGDDTGWIPVDNLNRFWRICNNAGDDLTYMVL